MQTGKTTTYYILGSGFHNMALIYNLPDPGPEDSWWQGQVFVNPPREVIVAEIIANTEEGVVLPFYNAATIMSDAFYDALCEAGVDNIDVYDAVVRSEDGKIEYKGFKAFNIIGLVRAADMKKSVFRDPHGTTLIDASIEKLEIDGDKLHGLKMFRLAENVGAVVIHEDVKKVLESKNIPHLQFIEPSQFTSL